MIPAFFLLLGLAAQSLAQSLSLPPLTGPSKVGTLSLELVDKSRSPPRDLMLSIFYPTKNTYYSTIAPVYTPLYASYLETTLGIPTGFASTVLSQSYVSPPLYSKTHHQQPNILLFSPGYGNSRVDYTATLENLASLGYIVIGLSHPNDTLFIDYPDGRTAIRTSEALNATTAATFVDIRVKDLQFVLDSFGKSDKLARQIPGVRGKLDVKKIGIFGHSLGGAAAASAILADRRFACGANLDGSFWGTVVEEGVDRPFLIVSADDHNRSSDLTWQGFWEHSKGWKVEISVAGAVHGTFSDQAVLYGYLRKLGLIGEQPVELFGTIDGERILVIESAYLGAFFDMCFEGGDGKSRTPKLLKGPSKKFPEVVFFPK